MASPSRPVAIICCAVLQAEVESLRRTHWPDHELTFLPSRLHFHPDRLASSTQSQVDSQLGHGRAVVLIYGDCCATMATLEAMPGVARCRGQNCCELLLGREEYRRSAREGAFFLLGEWAPRWKEVFVQELGLNENTRSMMQELHSQLVYLDTGLTPVPEDALRECAEYCGLPLEVRPVTLESLHSLMEEALSCCKPP